MGKKYELQDGLMVYENAGRVVIENEYKLGSSRLLVLNSEAAQKLLDFLVNGEVVSEVHKHELNAVEQPLAPDGADVCHIVTHVFIDGTCAMCGFPEPRPAPEA